MNGDLDDVNIVSVLYNSDHIIDYFIEGIRNYKNITVVNNASYSNYSELRLREIVPHANICSLKKNIGFGGGNNVGFYHQKMNELSQFTLFLNPDAQISKESIIKLRLTLINNNQVLAIAPRIVNENGKIDNYMHADYSNGFKKRGILTDTSLGGDEHDPDITEGVALQGCCFLVRNSHFSTIGCFDDNIFLYKEEDDIAIRAKLNGYTIAVNHTAFAHHLGGQSSEASKYIQLKKNYHHFWSNFYLIKKFDGLLLYYSTLAINFISRPLLVIISALIWKKKYITKNSAILLATYSHIFNRKIFR